MKLVTSFALFLLVSACATQAPQTIAPQVADALQEKREIASSGTGIAYPPSASFHMSELKGQTYITFLKRELKPALDKLSDKKNGGGGGWDNIGSAAYKKQAHHLNPKTLSKYRGAKWNRNSRSYEGGLSDSQIETTYETLKKIKPRSTTDSICYYDKDDAAWPSKNDMNLALRDARIKHTPFDLCTLYALTGGLGVKVTIDDNNYNYHVLYKTGKTEPREEVMSGRSFASSVGRGVADATDPEYLRDLQEYLTETQDEKPFYRSLILALANSEASNWGQLSNLGQAVLGDFLTVYTAEAVRHLMVDLKDGLHPWEIDLAAVTLISSLSVKSGKVVTGGVVVEDDIGAWFAPSPNNKPDGPQRSGIGITRRDRVKLQKAVHQFEMATPDGRALIQKIQKIIGNKFNKDDVIQGVFEYLSNNYTPTSMGGDARKLADLVAEFTEIAREDADEIMKTIK